MRIAHVTATFPPHFTGTGLVCYHNAVGLARLGHRVTVFTADYHLGSYVDPVEVSVHRLPAIFRAGNAPLLPQLLSIGGFDIVHLHHPFIFGAEMTRFVSQLRRIPYVVTHHNDLAGNGLRRHLFNLYSLASVPFVLGGARKFMVVSRDHADHCALSPLFRRRWKDVVEIPNGVDTDLFHPDCDGVTARDRHGIVRDQEVILFVGVLDRAHHFKGVDYLLKAFSLLRTPSAVLVIVGDGDMKAGLTSLAADLGVSGRSVFVGGLSHEETAAYYASADVVVLPSFPPESFGLVLIEAMACGRCVVANDIPGVRSVVNDGEDGLLARPGDVYDLAEKIQALLSDSTRRREMGERGRAKVETKYAWPKVIERLEATYASVLANTREASVAHGAT